jgi:hypothetical protein
MAKKFTKLAAIAAVGKKGGDAVDECFKRSGDDDPAYLLRYLKIKLEELVNVKLLDSKTDRIVVFIDDLDRLRPEKAVELLEAFKVFLDITGCIYVLACDYSVVVQGLKSIFGVDTDEKGKKFFDKIIQLPFNMPTELYKTGKYIESLLKRIDVDFYEEDINYYIDMARHSMGSNPRSLKRLFNSMLLINLVANKLKIFEWQGTNATKGEKQRILFGILCLQTSFEPVYSYIVKNPNNINNDFFNLLKDEKTLNNEKWFLEIRQKIDLKNLCSFCAVFYDAMQLASDPDKKGMSDKELRNIAELITFSAITSTESFSKDNKMFGKAWEYSLGMKTILEDDIRKLYKVLSGK